MIPFLPGRHLRSVEDAHGRARALLSDRLDAPLASDDAAWLDAHLEGCDECRAVELGYEDQRAMLRGLRMPEPPRDLWARTRAAIELEAGPRETASPRRRALVPVGALAGALVVAVVVGASLLSSPAVVVPIPSQAVAPSQSAAPSVPGSTPLAVAVADVGWLHRQADGTYALSYSAVDEVCDTTAAPDCPPLTTPSSEPLALDAVPRAIVGSPNKDQLVVVDAATRTSGVGGSIYVVPVAKPSVSPTASSSAAATVSPTPSSTPSPAGSSPSGTPGGSASPSTAVSPSPATSLSPTPSTASPPPTVEPSASPTPGISAGPSPSPSAPPDGQPIAIAQGVVVVGESAAYSPDGRWFAFSARPADGSRGPDIYVWQPGDATAHPVTHDGRSVFSTWVGGRILGSRIVDAAADPSGAASAAPAATTSAGAPTPSPSATADASAASPPASPSAVDWIAVSFLLDPSTGEEQVLAGDGIWRPVVDPTGRFAIYWQGGIVLDPNGVDWHPGDGRLVLAAWDADPQLDPSASPDASDAASPSAGSSVAASPSPVESAPDALASASPSPIIGTPIALTDSPVSEWDVRWDETGTRFALWLASQGDLSVGALTLHELDPATGTLDPTTPALLDAPALAGFSIGDGRLAWATAPGQDGEGSRLQVLAWSGEGAGQTQSEPSATDPILVVR